MRNVVIAGSGAVASELTSYIEDNNKYISSYDRINIHGYIDYEYNIKKYWGKYKFNAPVIADINSYLPVTEEEVLIGISDINFRNYLISEFLIKGAYIGSFIHHSLILSSNLEIGLGNIIYPFCIIGSNVKLGSYNMITSFSFISHDCRIGNGNFFSTTGIAGRVNIGDNNYFGIRSTVIPNVSIGNNNTIQAGMIVDKDVTDNSTVYYRFKEKVLAIPKTSTNGE